MKRGPRSVLNPTVPNRPALLGTGAKAKGSKYGCPAPAPPSISTRGLTWSARCVLPGALSDVPEDVTLKGTPDWALKRPLTCQPPSNAFPRPPPSQRLPLPNGNSTTEEI